MYTYIHIYTYIYIHINVYTYTSPTFIYIYISKAQSLAEKDHYNKLPEPYNIWPICADRPAR